jgi:hypothetical protein
MGHVVLYASLQSKASGIFYTLGSYRHIEAFNGLFGIIGFSLRQFEIGTILHIRPYNAIAFDCLNLNNLAGFICSSRMCLFSSEIFDRIDAFGLQLSLDFCYFYKAFIIGH